MRCTFPEPVEREFSITVFFFFLFENNLCEMFSENSFQRRKSKYFSVSGGLPCSDAFKSEAKISHFLTVIIV